MNKIFLALTVVFQMLVFSQTATPPAIGDGSEGDPYQITTLENLYWIAASTANWNKHYIQTNDINASETSSWFSGAGWIPIENFSGVYDGNGNTIFSLYINRNNDNQGFIGILSGEVKNLGLTNIDITGFNKVGGIAGILQILIDNCYTTGRISSNSGFAVGGLVGILEQGKIDNSYSKADITAYNDCGGIAGVILNSQGIIQQSYFSGSVNILTGPGKRKNSLSFIH